MVKSGFLLRRLGYRTKRYGGSKYSANKGDRKLVTKKQVKTMINRTIETKFLYSAYTSLSSDIRSTTPYYGLINGVVQGNTDNTRTGDRVRYGLLDMHVNIAKTGNNNTGTQFRVMLLRLKNPRGATPASSTIQLATNRPMEIMDDVNYDWNSRWAIEYDSGVLVYPMTQMSSQYQQYVIHIKKNLDLVTDYSLGNAGTIADIEKNALYLYITTDSGTVSEFAALYTFKLEFKDM